MYFVICIYIYIYIYILLAIYIFFLRSKQNRSALFPAFFLVFNPIFPTTNISCNYYNCPIKKKEISPIRCLGNTWLIRLSAHYD